MAELHYTDTIPILRGHLDELYAAIDTAHSYHIADDLRTEYKNVGGVHRPSNLTRRLAAALERLDGYLGEEEDERVPAE